MENELSTIQLQGMLREMGVKFSADESHEGLLKLLKEENHKKWLGLDEEGNVAKDKVVIKRKAKRNDLIITDEPDDTIIIENKKEVLSESTRPTRDFKKSAAKVEILPEHYKNIKNVKSYSKASRNVENLVMRRADGSCELCGEEGTLEHHYILSLEDGGENNVKNIVALCKSCIGIEKFSKSHIKVMKRKARSRISKDITIVYKK